MKCEDTNNQKASSPRSKTSNFRWSYDTRLCYVSRIFLVFLLLTNVIAWTNQKTIFRASSLFAFNQDGVSGKNIVVISPPGGVGEVAAVKAAESGCTVRWFIVSGTDDKFSASNVVLSREALVRIDESGGSIALAGTSASSLLIPVDVSESAVNAVGLWCGSADALICTTDGVHELKSQSEKDQNDFRSNWIDAVSVAVREASSSITDSRIAILPLNDFNDSLEETEGQVSPIAGLMNGIIGSRRTSVPKSLISALGSSKVIVLRHGQLFGVPESSPDFSPFIGGARKIPELCIEYRNRAVRVDLSTTFRGTRVTGSQTSRHSIGQAAALLATKLVPVTSLDDYDVCILSQQGTSTMTIDDWMNEFKRVEKIMNSGETAIVFEAEFGSVPDTERLTSWLAEKWAPAVLRTYDIAAIRTGARPVFTRRVKEDEMEIIWQNLINFESVVVGTLKIQVSSNGIRAIRGPGDAKAGFGTVESKPLPGEDVLVRRLGEAAAQAVEKGLAKKASPKESASLRSSSISVPQTIASVVTPSSSATVATPTKRRSTERVRGTKRKESSSED